jgi:hypothetical protein
VTAHILQENSTAVTTSAGWVSQTCASCSGGSDIATSAAGTATVALTGVRSAALVFVDAATDGSASISVDSASATTISTHATTTKYRTFGYVTSWQADGNHTVHIANQATTGHPQLQLDAIVTLS